MVVLLLFMRQSNGTTNIYKRNNRFRIFLVFIVAIVAIGLFFAIFWVSVILNLLFLCLYVGGLYTGLFVGGAYIIFGEEIKDTGAARVAPARTTVAKT